MKIAEIAQCLDAAVLTGEQLLDQEIETAFGSDMMSDVLAFSQERSLLLTADVDRDGQNNLLETAPEKLDVDISIIIFFCFFFGIPTFGGFGFFTVTVIGSKLFFIAGKIALAVIAGRFSEIEINRRNFRYFNFAVIYPAEDSLSCC